MRWNYTISAVRREMRIKANIDKKANIDFLTTKFEKTKLINLISFKKCLWKWDLHFSSAALFFSNVASNTNKWN